MPAVARPQHLRTKHGRKGNVDATALLERICVEVARLYWGPGAKSHVFGTGRRRSGTGRLGFRAAVNSFCHELSEGGQFQNRSGSRQTPSDQDDGLDVVVWSQFPDGWPGKLVGFGQCKTGSSWTTADLTRLQCAAFVESWFADRVPVKPVNLFFSTQRLSRDDLVRGLGKQDRGIILFDRCRILSQAANLSTAHDAQMTSWLNATLADYMYPPL